MSRRLQHCETRAWIALDTVLGWWHLHSVRAGLLVAIAVGLAVVAHYA